MKVEFQLAIYKPIEYYPVLKLDIELIPRQGETIEFRELTPSSIDIAETEGSSSNPNILTNEELVDILTDNMLFVVKRITWNIYTKKSYISLFCMQS